MQIIKYTLGLLRMNNFIIILTLFFTATGHVSANEDEPWSFTFAPYLWLAGQQGTVGTLAGLPASEIDVSTGDILDNLDIGLMGVAEARKGRFGVVTELFYIGITADANTPGPFFSSTAYEQEFLALSIAPFYRIINKKETSLDILAGLRWWHLDNELELSAGLLPARTVQTDEDWFDPIVGIKGRTMINANWFATGWAVSAVAGDSDSAWDVFAGIGYAFNDARSLTIGYRHQEVDYQSGSFLYDVETSGPLLGYVFRF
jgi:hypothetical protein